MPSAPLQRSLFEDDSQDFTTSAPPLATDSHTYDYFALLGLLRTTVNTPDGPGTLVQVTREQCCVIADGKARYYPIKELAAHVSQGG